MRHHGTTAGGLAALLLAAASPAALAAGKTELVSVSSAGVQADGDSGPALISGNGSVVAFLSSATNLVPGDTNGAPDIFVRDRATGTTVRVSVSTAGAQANELSQQPMITKEGRRVAFSSFATNLVPNDTNGRGDVFVRDLAAGTTTRVSVGPAGQQLDDVAFGPLAISADAQLVVFTTQDDLGHDKYLNTLLTRDLKAGTTTVESRNAQGQLANGQFLEAAMTLDGRYLAFSTDSTNLAPGADTGLDQIYVRDRQAGILSVVSLTPAGKPTRGEAFSPVISADGNVVAFSAVADDLVAGSGPAGHAVPYVRDLKAGKTTKLALKAGGGEPDGDVNVIDISSDGRYVLLASRADDILPGDVNDDGDAFVHDRLTGRTILAAPRPNGTFARKGGTYGSSISANGRNVAFASPAANLVAGDANGKVDVFVRKLPPPAAP